MTNHPGFICVGAQKAATTWLYRALSSTPGIFIPCIKELHYFSELKSPSYKEPGPTHRAAQIETSRTFHSTSTIEEHHRRRIIEQLNHIDTSEVNDAWYRGIFDFLAMAISALKSARAT